MSALEAWYAERRAVIHRETAPPPLIMGGMVYGDWYLDALEKCCLPSMLAPENLAALCDCNAQLAFFTDSKSRDRLRQILNVIQGRGIRTAVLMMPDEIMAEPRPFLRLSATQSLLVQNAARRGMPFHMVMPDHVYSERYFAGLCRLGNQYRNIVHGGINASWPGMTDDLDECRRDGALVIPSRQLATIGWKNTEMCSMNRATEKKLPDEHYHVWRAKDRVMLFNPHANPAYITPEAGRLMDEETATTATLDCHTQRLFGANFYIPQPLDDMVFVALSPAKPIPKSSFTSLDKFLARSWAEIGNRPEALVYYTRATEMATVIDETEPDAQEIVLRQQAIIQRMLAKAPSCKP